MSKSIISVPNDKCLLDVLAEMGEKIRNSWIYIHRNVYMNLMHHENFSDILHPDMDKNIFKRKVPKETLCCELPSHV